VIKNVRQTIVDPREALNGTSGVNLTTLDVGNLNLALNSNNILTTTNGAVGSSTAAAAVSLQANYNGVVYIYDYTDNSVNPTSTATATPLKNSLNGILLVDGATTPAVNDQNGNPMGFSVVSNNGVYVKGDYNTTQITVGGNQADNPAAVMGDAITAVSQGWNPASSLYPTLPPLTALAGEVRAASPSTAIAANPNGSTLASPAATIVEPAASPETVNGMQINAAMLTGNTPTNVAGGTNSGGAQNLVRMIEDWYYDPNNAAAPLTLTLNGSLGQLFTSKYFTGPYHGSSIATGVYMQPKTRVLSYDPIFKTNTPAGSPSTTAFTRGNFFFW
jgi:hypothetical protein